MRTIRGSRVLFLIFAFFPALACPAQTVSSANENAFKLDGMVINSITGQPIPRALVQITTTPQRSMLTGPEGEFSFENLTQSTASFVVSKPGFIPPEYNRSGGLRIALVDSHSGKVVLKLTPEAVIYGQVAGADEDPVEEATVEVLQSRMLRGRQELAPAYRTGFGLNATLPSQVQTDEYGNYRIAGLAPGNYYLVVNTSALSLRRKPQARAGLPAAKNTGAYQALIYYPGAADFESAMPIRIKGGERLEADFSLKRVPTFTIAGVVDASPEWKQINPPMIVDESDQTLFTADEFADSGAFRFKAVPAGTYTVRLGGNDQNGMYRAAYRKLVVAGPVKDLKLHLPTALTVPVVLHSELTKPRLTGHCTSSGPDGQMHISDCSDFPQVVLELLSGNTQRGGSSAGYGPQQDPNDLKLQGVMPGRYWVQARAQFGGYIAALRSGSVDLLRDPLVVPDEGGVPPIEVTLRDDTATVKVQLHSDTPGQRGWAVLVPDLLSRDPLVVDVQSGTDRDYQGVPPGTYKAFAVDSRDGIDFSNPESLSKYTEKATSITLTPNGSTTVPIELLHRED